LNICGHIDMVFHMKTTLNIPDPLFRQLKRKAAERGETVTVLVEELLRKGLAERPPARRLAPLPSFKCGRVKVNIADRDRLYRAMEE
jgi:hypothetical protein